MRLDPQQTAAATATEDKILLVAGAGSGKTRTLIGRINHLIESGVSPYEIMAFTFTRKAAGEMAARVEDEIGPAARGCTIGTMHGLAMRFLKNIGETIGIKPAKLTVYNEWEQTFLLRETAKDLGIYKGTKWIVPKKTVDEAFNDYYQNGNMPEESHPAYQLFTSFMARCRENNAMTYGGLLFGLQLLIPEMTKHFTFSHILVDEVQDIDPLQWQIIADLSQAFGASLFVCGDIDQSIYEWRGAVPEYLLEMQAGFATYLLENNYRSGANIVNAANRLIRHNVRRIDKVMRPARENAEPVTYFRDVSSDTIVKIVRGLQTDPRTNHISRRAVLARNHVLLAKLSKLLTEAGIKHQYIGKKTAISGSEPFRRFHAFLKLAINPYDNFAFLIIRQILGLSRGDYNKLRLKSLEAGLSHFETWRGDDTMPGREFSDLYDAMTAGGIINILDWSEGLLTRFRDQDRYHDAMDFIVDYAEPYGEYPPTVENYLTWLATMDIQDEMTEESELMLMTVHAAKGLEWPTVIIAGLNEGLLPSKQAIRNDEIEAERRLAYVAMTRAEDSLILTSRPEITQTEDRTFANPISRFLYEALSQDKKEEAATC
jgi:superfamily I DNA/RNA helicase